MRAVREDPNVRCPACTGQVVQELEVDDALRIDGEVVEEVRGSAILEICWIRREV